MIDTRAMYKKPPAVNGKSQVDALLICSAVSPVTTPTNLPHAVNICALAASRRLNPDFRRIAKSPTSWGISWQRMVSVVSMPTMGLGSWQLWPARP